MCLPHFGRCSQGSQLPAQRGGAARPSPRASGHQGALQPPSPGSSRASPVGVSLSLSRSLFRPHIRVWSAAALSVLLRSRRGAGPGRGKWRRREAERRPRSALNPRNFRSPTTFREVLPLWGRGRKGEGSEAGEVARRAAGSRRDSNPRRRRWRVRPSPRRRGHLLPRVLPAAAEGGRAARRAGPLRRRRAEPSRAASPRPPGPVAPTPPRA